MTVAQQHTYTAPFDAVAARYDEAFTFSNVGRAQRASVWKELAKTFAPGDRILEIGCGTAVDACFLADRAVQVLACDSSPLMIEAATRRIRENGREGLVQPVLLRAEDLSTLPRNKLFDGVFSNFGAMNCVEDFNRLARDLAAMVKPGGVALLCWMGRYCFWEMAWYLGQGNWRKAFRRVTRKRISARIADGALVQVRYLPVKLLAHRFTPWFRLQSVKGIGVIVPPSYLEFLTCRHPRLFRVCERADLLVGRCPGIRTFADHVLLRFQREATTPE